MNFNERKEKFLSEYNALPSDMERFDYIINKGMRSACDYAPSEEDRIEGCDSGLWLCASAEGGFVSVRAHSGRRICHGACGAHMRADRRTFRGRGKGDRHLFPA